MAQDYPSKALEKSVAAGLEYMRRSQNEDGSFGSVQRHLQTGLAILAFLSAGATPGGDPASPLPKAAAWIIENSGEDGFLGDSEYPMESHAVAALALSELVGQAGDAELDRKITLRAADAFEYSLRIQDKAVNPEFYGGWKADLKTKVNDRKVTAWFLLFLRSMELRGGKVPINAAKRALSFMEGSQKIPGPGKQYEKEDVGGFSYDAAGLPIISITGAGIACMGLYDRPAKQRDLALDWLARNRPIWYGPNFYDAHFFASRGYLREKGRGGKQAEQAEGFFRGIWEILREHQNPDGSFQIPPGNAENTKVMGGTYATPMAILILDAERGLLPLDYR